jgi:hypothetical protein
MVLNTAHDYLLAPQVIDDTSQIAVHFFSHQMVTQKWPAFFRGENRMDEDFGQ